ncbi:MAG: YlbF family regulator [Oscillospiraceae bacterium]
MDVISLTRELGKAIQQDERYLNLVKTKEANDADQGLQKQIAQFNELRIELNKEISKEEKDNDKLTELDKEIQGVFAEIMKNENMVKFNEAKGEIDKMMKFINEILMGTMNGENPDEIQEHQCTGSCSSCSSCN